MKRERKQRYKRLKKLFKARDMASKYIDMRISISLLDSSVSDIIIDQYFTSDLAKRIVDTHMKILGLNTIRAPKPPKTKSNLIYRKENDYV